MCSAWKGCTKASIQGCHTRLHSSMLPGSKRLASAFRCRRLHATKQTGSRLVLSRRRAESRQRRSPVRCTGGIAHSSCYGLRHVAPRLRAQEAFVLAFRHDLTIQAILLTCSSKSTDGSSAVVAVDSQQRMRTKPREMLI